MVQDRNLFLKDGSKCPHCNKSRKTVDHVATKCEKALPIYKMRHDEVLRCIHLSLTRKYNFSDNQKIKYHKVLKVIDNPYAKIVSDMNFTTNNSIQFNKPDIVVFDNLNKKITIVEIGITSQENLQQTESFK